MYRRRTVPYCTTYIVVSQGYQEANEGVKSTIERERGGIGVFLFSLLSHAIARRKEKSAVCTVAYTYEGRSYPFV